MDHVENVGIEEIDEIIREFAKHGEEVVDREFAKHSEEVVDKEKIQLQIKGSHEVVNNILLFVF